MVKLIIGKKGTGKTKQLIEEINAAVQTDTGHICFINNGTRHMFDLDPKIRMVDTAEFSIENFDMLYGLISGMIAGDYDISNIFLDSLTKIVPACELQNSSPFLCGLEKITAAFNFNVTITVSVDVNDAPDFFKKYL